MKLRVTNLGPLKDVSLPLRPLTAILGPNHVGKTWLAYAVYAAARAMGNHFAMPVLAHEARPAREGDLSAMLGRLGRSLTYSAEMATASLPYIYQDRSPRVSSATLTLEAEGDELERALRASLGPTITDPQGRLLPARGPKAKRDPTLWPAERLRAGVSSAMQQLMPSAFALPAERNALVLTYKMLAQRRLKSFIEARRIRFLWDDARTTTRLAKQESLYRELGELRFPQPVEDFLEFLADCEMDERARPPDPVSSFASVLETAALAGNRLIWESVGSTARELKLHLADSPPLDLYNASSAVKQLAPLLLWLRHGHPGGLLIIDEPELNLHPTTQARLLEALAILVKLGKKVLITTHSPYFMAHLNNLIAGSTTDEDLQARQAKHLYLQDPRAFLRPEDVGAWQMDADGLHDLHEAARDIRWDTLSDASAEMQRLYFAIRQEEEGGEAD